MNYLPLKNERKGITLLLILANCVIHCFLPLNTAAFNLSSTDSIPHSHAVKAAELCQQLMFDEALYEIDAAFIDHGAEKDEYLWYVRGFVYKEIYKHRESAMRNSPAREFAVESFLHLRELQRKDNSDFSADAAMQYIARTYYNDALLAAMDFTIINIAESTELFAKYQNLATTLNSETNIQSQLADFSRARGMRFYKLWQDQKEEYQLFQWALQELDVSLINNPSDCNTRYNIAVANYEMARFRNDESYLTIATNQLHGAEQICADNVEVLKGLLNVYKLKNETELVRFYENRIADLIQKNNNLKN